MLSTSFLERRKCSAAALVSEVSEVSATDATAMCCGWSLVSVLDCRCHGHIACLLCSEGGEEVQDQSVGDATAVGRCLCCCWEEVVGESLLLQPACRDTGARPLTASGVESASS